MVMPATEERKPLMVGQLLLLLLLLLLPLLLLLLLLPLPLQLLWPLRTKLALPLSGRLRHRCGRNSLFCEPDRNLDKDPHELRVYLMWVPQ